MKTFKVLSLLLEYPPPELWEALPEMRRILDVERLIPEPARSGVYALIDDLEHTDVMEAQATYVGLFDRGRHLSLHLFEHLIGESRDRGTAMVQLIEHYRACGFELGARELPDHVPLILEFLSRRTWSEAQEMLGEAMPVLTLLGERLRQRDSRYGAVFEALEAAIGPAEEADQLRRMAAEEGPDETVTRMDEIWEEEQVTFMPGAGAGGCSPQEPATQPIQWVQRPGRPAAAAGQ